MTDTQIELKRMVIIIFIFLQSIISLGFLTSMVVKLTLMPLKTELYGFSLRLLADVKKAYTLFTTLLTDF